MLARNSLALLGFAIAALGSCSDDKTGGGPGYAGSGGSAAAGGNAVAGSGGNGASSGVDGGGDANGASGGTGGNAGSGGSAGSAGSSGTGGSAGADGGPAVLIEPIQRGDDYVLEFEDIRFVVIAAGGRITEFSKATVDMLNASHAENFGSTLWSSPQNPDWGWPPPAALDSAPYTVEVAGNTITMTSGIASFSNHQIRAIKRFSPDLDARAIVIEYSLNNEGTASDTFAPWEVTRVNPSGLSFFPSADVITGPLSGHVTRVGGHTWFDHSPPDTFGQKLYSDGTASWIAHTDETRLFVKQWTDVPSNQQAPNEAEVEIYDGTTYVELEAQGVYGSVAPGASVMFTVRWYLRDLPPGTTVTVGSSTLVDAVEAILR